MMIRKAEAADLSAIRKIHDAAFGGPGEGKLVADLMADGLDAVSLVAVEGREIVGHILFSPLTVELNGHAIRALALAPLGIAPHRQRRGFGRALVQAGLAAAVADGWEAVIVLGHPDYYASLGFRADLASGFRAPFQGPAFMALELQPGALSGQKGRIIYPARFDITESELIAAGH